MDQQVFNRDEYFTKTELLKIYSIPWNEFEELFKKYNIQCLLVRSSSYPGGKATYVKKTDVEKFEPFLKRQEKFYKADLSYKLSSVFHEVKFPNARIPEEIRPVELFFKAIHLQNGIIYKVGAFKEYRTTSSGGVFFIEKVQGKWSIVKNPGAPIWILDSEEEIVDFITNLELLHSKIEKNQNLI